MEAPPVQYLRTTDAFNIAVTRTGSGEPLVMLPAVFGHCQLAWSSPLYNRTYRHLGESFRLVQYDGRGHGMSTRGLPETLTFEDFMCDLETVMDGLNLKRALLFASYHHAKEAMRYAVRHPARVRALILRNAFTRMTSSAVAGSGESLGQTNWDYLVEATARTAFPQDDITSQLRIHRAAITQIDFLRTLRVLNNENMQADVALIRVPTLVMATMAKASSFGAEEASKELAASIPGARFILYEDAGGGLFTLSDETPPAIRAMREFVNGIDEPPVMPVRRAPAASLSDREIEVLRLVAAGKSNAQIGDELVISPRTVDRHVANILSKTGASNRTQAVAFAREQGLT